MPSPHPIPLIPLDSRPVCYDLPLQLAAMAGHAIALPPKDCLGHLKAPANHQTLMAWAESMLATTPVSKGASPPWLVSLDTLIYGGLIASRQGHEPLTALQHQWHQWQNLLCNQRIAGFASILRIPNANNASEEPDYWATYGTQLHQLSIELHRNGMASGDQLARIPSHVWQHFLNTRHRNRTIIEDLIHAYHQGHLSELILYEDDTGPWGLNRLEADQHTATMARLSVAGRRQTGADEVAATLLTKTILSDGQKPRIAVVFTHEKASKRILKFDGITARQLVHQQLRACGGLWVDDPNDADIILWCHTPPKYPEKTGTDSLQGDHCEGDAINSFPSDWAGDIDRTLRYVCHLNKPVIIGDIAVANGSDPHLLAALTQGDLTPQNHLIAYAGWNTPGNAMGTALATGLLHWWANQHNQLHHRVWQTALLTRFIDDGLYQAQYRYQLSLDGPFDSKAESTLTQAMAHDCQQWAAWCGLPHTTTTITFPCHRRFEIAVTLDD